MHPSRTRLEEPLPLALPPEEIRAQIRRILESAAFRGSNRCRGFLEFVVQKALNGEADTLKERTLAVEVYGRDVDADLAEDSIVRVGAREVRKRLAQFYIEEGAADPIRVELPAGCYIPTFHLTATHSAAAAPARDGAPLPTAAPRSHRRLIWMAAALALVLAAVGWAWVLRRPATGFDAFWEPAFGDSAPPVIALAHPLVYHPSTRAILLTEAKDGPSALSYQRPLDVAPELLTGKDFVPVFDQYVGFGDTVAALELAGMFSHRARPARVRLASRVDFTDLRDSPAVLIGGFTNRWTTELTQKFRYQFGYTERRQPCIVDQATGKRAWTLDKADNNTTKEDYLLICRIPRSATGKLLVVAAGMNQQGTQEAGRILANPRALIPVLKRLPSQWERQNLQLVLHAQVVADTPTVPELAAWHIW